MIEGAEYTRKYTVVFTRSNLKRFYVKWLDVNFAHVSILRVSDCGKHWIMAESVGGNIFLDTFPLVDLREIYVGNTIIDVWSVPQVKPTMKIAHLNCVELIKMVLGIRKFSIFTPLQLYKYLTNDKEEKHCALRYEH